MLKDTKTYKSLKEFIDATPLTDAHEHLGSEPALLQRPCDFLCQMLQYSSDDLAGCGNAFPRQSAYRDPERPLEERWESWEPLYARAKNTGYLQALRKTCRALWGVEPDSVENLRRINEGMLALREPGMLERLVCGVANVETAIAVRQPGSPPDPPFIKRLIAIDEQLTFAQPDILDAMCSQTGVRVRRVEHLEEHYRRFIEQCERQEGFVGFKSPIAYLRPLAFPRSPRDEAQAVLQRVTGFMKASWMPGSALSLEEAAPLTNYALHLFLEILDGKGLPISFHTGIQAAGRNDIRRTNPTQLTNLFHEYPSVRFDLFHGGYPYCHEWIELGKSWPNVYLNMCWLNGISPVAARAALSEALECVPVNKIFAFGGDVGMPHLVVGYAMQARENVALVLAEKVELGIFSMDEAKEYAERILRLNAREMWNL